MYANTTYKMVFAYALGQSNKMHLTAYLDLDSMFVKVRPFFQQYLSMQLYLKKTIERSKRGSSWFNGLFIGFQNSDALILPTLITSPIQNTNYFITLN